jgi:hypothetical protein
MIRGDSMSGVAGVRFAMLHAFLLICSFRAATTTPPLVPGVVLSATTSRPSCCKQAISGKNVMLANARAKRA